MTIYDIVDISKLVSDEMYNKIIDQLLSTSKVDNVKARLIDEDPYAVFVNEFSLCRTCSNNELEDFRERLI